MPHEPLTCGAVRFDCVRGATIAEVARLFQTGSFRIFRPRPEPGDILNVVLLNTSGGIVGGDRLEVRAGVETGAAAVITSQAAEKVYRSLGAEAEVDVRFEVAGDAWLEWLPQETILFDRARLRRTFRVDLGPEARLIAGDILVFGRRARGERFRSGRLLDRWEVHVGGRLVWVDSLRLKRAPGTRIEAPFGFAGAGAYGTCIYVAPDAAGWLSLARRLTERPGVRAATSLVGPVLIVRWLADEPAAVKDALRHFCAAFRHAVRGLPARAPVIWNT